MKALIFSALSLFSIASFATDDTKICESLYDEAIHGCEVVMCEDAIKDDGEAVTDEAVNECINNSDGDLMEGAQICAIDGGEYETLVKAYNDKNPKAKINCEDN